MINQNQLPIWEQRMFNLMDMLIFTKKIENQEQFMQSIGAEIHVDQTRPADDKPLFGNEQFYKASELYNISMDWFYGFTEIMRRPAKDDPLRMMKDALALLEKQIKANNIGQ